jgi:hypothetical protein
VQEYQTSELRKYFKEDALLYPLDTIIGKPPYMNLSSSVIMTLILTFPYYRENDSEGFRLLPGQWQLPEGGGHLGEVRGGATRP